MLGRIVSAQSLLTYLAVLSVFLVWFLLKKTHIVRIRAVGEKPSAAESVGISVPKIGYISLCVLRHFRRPVRRVPLHELGHLLHEEHGQRPRLHRPFRPEHGGRRPGGFRTGLAALRFCGLLVHHAEEPDPPSPPSS